MKFCNGLILFCSLIWYNKKQWCERRKSERFCPQNKFQLSALKVIQYCRERVVCCRHVSFNQRLRSHLCGWSHRCTPGRKWTPFFQELPRASRRCRPTPVGSNPLRYEAGLTFRKVNSSLPEKTSHCSNTWITSI